MVTIIKTKLSTNAEGKEFVAVKVQGGIEAVQSQNTGRMYLTAKTAYVATTFDEVTAEALIGSQIPGMVKRVPSEPYEYTIRDTGEVVSLSHRYEYLPEATKANMPAVIDFEEEETTSLPY